MSGEDFAFARWYCQSFPYFSTYKSEYFNRCAIDDWRGGYR